MAPRRGRARPPPVLPLLCPGRETPRLYHIVLNTERLSIEACVKAVCDLAESPRFRDRATTRSMLANKLLEAKIGSAFAEQIGASMAPLGVSVSVANGKVTLD